MFGKPPITVVQEYCAKNHFEPPVYKSMGDKNEGDVRVFVAQICALGGEFIGEGRSKKDAKHDAAKNLIAHLRVQHPGLDEIPQANMVSISAPSTDAVRALRDLCVQRDCPLPNFEMVQQAGPPESPQYTYQCTVAQIVRIASALTKKMAKQLAAQQMIDILQSLKHFENKDNLQVSTVTPVENAVENVTEDNYRKFKSYRELTESDVKVSAYSGRKFCERFLYFKKFYDEIKFEALKILRSNDYLTQYDKVVDLMKTLKLKYKISSLNMLNMETHVVFEVFCEIDVVFINNKDLIYNEILEYFAEMLL